MHFISPDDRPKMPFGLEGGGGRTLIDAHNTLSFPNTREEAQIIIRFNLDPVSYELAPGSRRAAKSGV